MSILLNYITPCELRAYKFQFKLNTLKNMYFKKFLRLFSFKRQMLNKFPAKYGQRKWISKQKISVSLTFFVKSFYAYWQLTQLGSRNPVHYLTFFVRTNMHYWVQCAMISCLLLSSQVFFYKKELSPSTYCIFESASDVYFISSIIMTQKSAFNL